MTFRPRRSMLFSPGANPRALEKAKTLPADCLIFDLEDSVSPEEKESARLRVAGVLADEGYGNKERLVRVNGLDTPWGLDDIIMAATTGADGVLVPKIYSAADIEVIAGILAHVPTQTRIWVMIETARALLNITEIVKNGTNPTCNLAGMILGTNDIARETGVPMIPGRGPMVSWMSQCVLAAKAYDVAIIDSVYNDFRNLEGFRDECRQGRELGFDGKTLIHPAQIDIANEMFLPSAQAILDAQAIVDAFNLPENQEKAVISLDGKMVEKLHLEMAQRTLTMAGRGGD